MRTRFKLRAGVLALLCLSNHQLLFAEETLPEIQVKTERSNTEQQPTESTHLYTVKSSNSTTRLNTSLKDTPQSISVLTRQIMDDFKLNTINDALDYTTGIKVDKVETDRTYFTARGSEVSNIQLDGIGAPFLNGYVSGDIDTAIYDRIEVVRGANGLLSGTGNPSATINLIRKRTTRDFQAKINLSAGSWNNRRAEADISGALNEAGNVRGRLVLVTQTRDSYLDHYSVDKNIAYGILEADITEQTTLAVGHTYQQNNANSPLWGALPMTDQNGNRVHYGRSASTSQDWSYWDNEANITFAELTHHFSNGWDAKAVLTRKESMTDSKIFYVAVSDGLTQVDPAKFSGRYTENLADFYASGPINLGGREHELVVGTSWSRSVADEKSLGVPGTYITVSGLQDIYNYPLPALTELEGGNFDIQRLNSYAAIKLNLSDALKVTAGANMVSYKSTGENYGSAYATKHNDKVAPYLGGVYALNTEHSLYASYTEIFKPQVELGQNLKPLEPLTGKNYEVGFKSELFDKALNTSIALFKTKQENYAQYLDQIGGISRYKGISRNTKGIEFDVAGKLTERLQINGGFTLLTSIKDDEGNTINRFTPRRMLRISSVYKVPNIENLKVGASVNWQNKTYSDDLTVAQDSYAVLNIMANYDINPHWSAALNVYNLTNEKYLNSLMWTQAYYAAPRNAMATLTWKY